MSSISLWSHQPTVEHPSKREEIYNYLREEIVTLRRPPGSPISDKEISAELQISRTPVREAIAAATKVATAQDISDLRKIVNDQKKAANSSQIDFYELDEAFHKRIFSISGHDEAWETILRSKAQLDRVRYLSLNNQHRLSEVIAEHSAIIDAIEKGKESLAEEKMLNHLNSAYINVDRAIKIYQQYFAHTN